MNIELRQASSRILSAGMRSGRDDRRTSPGGLQQMVARASQRLATRRALVLAEHETERLWFWRLVKLEVERTRRNDHSFSVLCLRGLDEQSIVELAHQLRPHLRGTDALLAERDRLLILLSETSSKDARRAMYRLARHCVLMPRDAQWEEVAFPRDAITFGALTECLLSPNQGARLLLAG